MPDFDLTALAAKFPWWTMLSAFLIAAGAIHVFAPVARRFGWVDKPGTRKQHEGEIPLIGGWAVLVAMLGVAIAGPSESAAPAGYWVGALLLFGIAVIDDRTPVRARYRFAVQIICAVAGVFLGGQVLPDLGDLFGTGALSAWWIVAPVSVLGIVAVINAVNFSDGADGLCAGLGFISLFWFLIAVALATSMAGNADNPPAAHASSLIPLAAAMMGGLAGFLLFNLRTPWRRKASVFLGDSGSMLIGFTLAWFAIHVCSAYGPSSVRPVVCLWIMAIPLADAASCFFRRMRMGEAPTTADMKHLHHLVQRYGLTNGQAVFAIHASSFLCGLFGVTCWWLGIADQWILYAFIVLLTLFVAATNVAWRRIDSRQVLARAPA